MKSKTEFVCIQPKNEKAKDIFNVFFKQLHSCQVLKKVDNNKYVKSIAGDYYFWIYENDKNWNLIK